MVGGSVLPRIERLLTKPGAPGLVAAAAVVVLRLPLLLASDRLHALEESRTGVFAAARLARESVALHDTWFYHYEGGSLLESLAALPLFRLFGESGAALKLTPLVVSAVLAWLVVALAELTLGRRAAWLACVLVAGAPPYFAGFTLYATGNHLYAFTADALVLVCAARWARSVEHRERHALLTGAAGAFGVFLHAGALLGATLALGVGLLGVHWCSRATRRELLAWTAGTLGAGVPLVIAGGLARPDGVLGILRRIVVARELLPSAARERGVHVARLFFADVPHASGYVLGACLLPLGIAGAVGAAVRAFRQRDAALLTASLLPVYVVVYLALGLAPLSARAVGLVEAYKYVYHLFPQLLLGLAALAAATRRAGTWGAAAFGLAGVLGQTQLVAPEAFHVERPRILGADFTWLGKAWTDRDGARSAEHRCSSLARPLHRALCLRGIGFAGVHEQVAEPCAVVTGAGRSFCEEGRGMALVERLNGFTERGAARVAEACAQSADPAACARGIEESWAVLAVDLPLPAALAALFHAGRGTWLGTVFGESPSFARARCGTWAPGDRAACERGVTWRAGELDALRGTRADTSALSPALAAAYADGQAAGWTFTASRGTLRP